MKSNKSFEVKIKWEHGDADSNSKTKTSFSSETEIKQFLNFIYEVRKFKPNEGYENTGYFSDGHYERMAEWVEKIANKHNSVFIEYMEHDKYFDAPDYYASIDAIHVKVDGIKHNIVWNAALQTNIIELPNVGDTIKTNTGNISNYGKVFGGDQSQYLHYNTLREIYPASEPDKYGAMDVKVLDVKINKYSDNTDYTSFEYLILAEVPAGKVTLSMNGFDPTYEAKFNKAPYDGLNVFLV